MLNRLLSACFGRVAVACVLLATSQATAVELPPGVVQREFLFEAAPFPSCHAATLAEVDGQLIAAWFAGQHEKAPDVGIWVARQQPNGWSPPVEVANGVQPVGDRLPCWNPVLFQPAQGPLLLFYKVGPSPQAWWGMLITSTDRGRSWSAPRRLPDGILGPIKNKPIQLSSGEILCPSSTESESTPSRWRVHFERTGDLGATWSRSTPAPATPGTAEIDAIQPSILIHADGALQAIGRSRVSRLFTTSSRDAGRTWNALELTSLPNPNSGTDAVALRDGRHLLVYNHTTKGRTPINVAVSQDGVRWQAALILENDPGEYSYPACIQAADGKVHVLYTWQRQRIRHVVIDVEKLVPRDMSDGHWPESSTR